MSLKELEKEILLVAADLAAAISKNKAKRALEKLLVTLVCKRQLMIDIESRK